LESKLLHDWPVTRDEAFHIQMRLAPEIELFGNFDDIHHVAAVETAYGTDPDIVYVAAVVVSFPDIEEIDRACHAETVTFPYLPGYYYFREGRAIVKALEKLKQEPDIIMVHGHGIAHPRRIGMASHLGLAMDKPTIGCCRKLLAGQHKTVAPTKGSCQPIVLQGKEVGFAYRSKDNVKPIFISPGHKCTLEQSRDIVVRSLRGFRLPEPLRLAHLFANKFKRGSERKRSV